ncbi:protein disulfide isomerase (PDI) protein [Irineochytrium annulatum]|nr:protein disulfide isomerase (PDI) protein [Irineochytrium annulatum]
MVEMDGPEQRELDAFQVRLGYRPASSQALNKLAVSVPHAEDEDDEPDSTEQFSLPPSSAPVAFRDLVDASTRKSAAFSDRVSLMLSNIISERHCEFPPSSTFTSSLEVPVLIHKRTDESYIRCMESFTSLVHYPPSKDIATIIKHVITDPEGTLTVSVAAQARNAVDRILELHGPGPFAGVPVIGDRMDGVNGKGWWEYVRRGWRVVLDGVGGEDGYSVDKINKGVILMDMLLLILEHDFAARVGRPLSTMLYRSMDGRSLSGFLHDKKMKVLEMLMDMATMEKVSGAVISLAHRIIHLFTLLAHATRRSVVAKTDLKTYASDLSERLRRLEPEVRLNFYDHTTSSLLRLSLVHHDLASHAALTSQSRSNILGSSPTTLRRLTTLLSRVELRRTRPLLALEDVTGVVRLLTCLVDAWNRTRSGRGGVVIAESERAVVEAGEVGKALEGLKAGVGKCGLTEDEVQVVGEEMVGLMVWAEFERRNLRGNDEWWRQWVDIYVARTFDNCTNKLIERALSMSNIFGQFRVNKSASRKVTTEIELLDAGIQKGIPNSDACKELHVNSCHQAFSSSLANRNSHPILTCPAMHRLLLLLLSVLSVSQVQALYSSRDAVITATPKNFKDVVLNTDSAVIVEFFAPWCGHCKNLAPEYKKAAEKLKGLGKVVAIDCDDHKELCGQYGVNGFPTLKLFGADKKNPSDYQGARTAKGIVDAVIGKIPNFVKPIGSSEKLKTLEDFLTVDSKPKAILLSSKGKTPPLFKALSAEFKKGLTFGEAKSSDADVTAILGEAAPAVFVFENGSEKPVKYEGEMKYAGLSPFLSKYAPAKKGKEGKDGGSEKAEKKPAEAPQEPFDPVVPEIKTQQNLEELCTNKAGVCVIALLTLEPDFEESVAAHKADFDVVTKLKKKYYDKKSPFNFTWLNVIEHGKELIRQFDISDIYPGFIAINAKKNVYRIHRGAFDEASISSFLDDMKLGKGRNLKFTFTPTLEKAKKEKVAKDEL